MQKFMSLVLVMLLTGWISPVWADRIDAASTISEAVVYPSSARITRTVKTPLKEGIHTIRLKGVQPGFDENSLSVSGKGSASVKILGAGIKSEQLTVSPDERVRELEQKIQSIDDEVARLQGAGNSLNDKKAFLDSVRLFNAGQLPKDLVTKMPTAEELKATLTFLEGELKTYEDARQEMNVTLRGFAKDRQALQNELNQLRSGVRTEERVLAVDLECDKAGDINLEVAYTLPAVSWYPLYDARVDFEKNKAVLSAYAVVNQTTGEDWKDVTLTLSTSRPSVGGRMPELSSWYLRPYEARRNRSAGIMGGMAKMSMEVDMLADKEEMASNMAMPASAPAERKAEVAYAQALTSGAALVYKPGRPVSIKSDGSDARVPLTVQTLDVAFEYTATPKLSPFAYLKSMVTNGPNDQLLAGRVNAFLDGTYVGASDIQKTIAPGEKFDLYLGVDEGVVVKRELIEEKSDDTLIANIPSPNKKITYKYKITVESYKPKAITVKLFDQVPVAQDDKIKVMKAQPSIKPDTDKYKDREGVYLWTLTLQPKEKKEILFSYVVEYPRDLGIDGL